MERDQNTNEDHVTNVEEDEIVTFDYINKEKEFPTLEEIENRTIVEFDNFLQEFNAMWICDDVERELEQRTEFLKKLDTPASDKYVYYRTEQMRRENEAKASQILRDGFRELPADHDCGDSNCPHKSTISPLAVHMAQSVMNKKIVALQNWEPLRYNIIRLKYNPDNMMALKPLMYNCVSYIAERFDEWWNINTYRCISTVKSTGMVYQITRLFDIVEAIVFKNPPEEMIFENNGARITIKPKRYNFLGLIPVNASSYNSLRIIFPRSNKDNAKNQNEGNNKNQNNNDNKNQNKGNNSENEEIEFDIIYHTLPFGRSEIPKIRSSFNWNVIRSDYDDNNINNSKNNKDIEAEKENNGKLITCNYNENVLYTVVEPHSAFNI